MAPGVNSTDDFCCLVGDVRSRWSLLGVTLLVCTATLLEVGMMIWRVISMGNEVTHPTLLLLGGWQGPIIFG